MMDRGSLNSSNSSNNSSKGCITTGKSRKIHGNGWENMGKPSMFIDVLCCQVAIEKGTTLHLRREELVSEGLIDNLGPQP